MTRSCLGSWSLVLSMVFGGVGAFGWVSQAICEAADNESKLGVVDADSQSAAADGQQVSTETTGVDDRADDDASENEPSEDHQSEDGAEEKSLIEEGDAVVAGHSSHGEAFNQGPRQAAVLMEGMGNIDFPTSANGETTQAFVTQGVAALHGFWYLEAERFFRQAAQLQPDLAIAYWGMAQANVNNQTRAREFITKATEHLDGATQRERMYIEAFAKYLKKPEKKESKEQIKKRRQQYITDLEQLLHKFPDDVEARAFLALQLWTFRGDVPITSYYAVNGLLSEVFAANPLHPAHHYRIHLWDGVRAENALHSAAMCGPSLPAVAHMWHMPGHTYSKLNRYADAAWQQEASARVDHAHMIDARLLPDQIHNFAHNNEWLVRNLNFLGRVEDALAQSRNLVALPRHPTYNSVTKRGSFLHGRTRLLQTLTEFELWDVLIQEADGPYLDPTSDEGLRDERLAWLVAAHHLSGDKPAAERLARGMHRRRIALESEALDLEEQLESLQEADRKADKRTGQLAKLRTKLKELKALIARSEAAAAVAAKDAAATKEHLGKAGRLDAVLAASWIGQAGDHAEAITRLEKLLPSRPGEIRPLAVLIDQLWRADKKDEAVERFATLRTLAAHADLETPLLVRLKQIAEKAGTPDDWRVAPVAATDIGERPSLDSLGPPVWQPYSAPHWKATTPEDNEITDDVYQGKAKILVFYLGFGCLHCVEQLSALKPKAADFAEAGIEIVAISTETLEELRKGIQSYGEPLPMAIFADPSHEVFKSYRCWDDFESLPLHGTFLIDARGQVRWQDIGHEPFKEVDFLLEESRRLLALPQ
jgi:peroxiredoxin